MPVSYASCMMTVKNIMTRRFFLPLLLVLFVSFTASAQKEYFPAAGAWERRSPEQSGFDPAVLKDAIDAAIAAESKMPRDLEEAHFRTFGREPYGEPLGPFKERGAPTGIVVRNGYIVAEWGEPSRVDMTFSATKSFLSAVVGLAYDRHLIRSLQDRVVDYWAPTTAVGQKYDDASQFKRSRLIDLYATDNNKKITCETFLRQTSDWEGTLWGKPDWADRPDPDANKWLNRQRNEPGISYEYNDVRVNALALAALNVWRKPLPVVLKENIMDEIGASNTWRWYGYENSWIVLDGQNVQSVSGGGHWGGGMFINAYDMARFGLMTERGGRWRDKQILSSDFVRQARTPTSVQPTYGFMNWFLNTDRKLYPSAPAGIFVHTGNGVNIIVCDPDNDLVVVVRWIENNKIDDFLKRIYASIKK